MEFDKDKLKILVYSFFILSISLIGGWTLFRYVFDIKLGLLDLKSEFTELWIPVGSAAIAVYFVFRKRLQILNLKNRDASFLYYVFLSLIIGFSSMGIQIYLSNNAFELICIEHVDEVKNYPNEKYFHIQKY